jgi:hypothetical protein
MSLQREETERVTRRDEIRALFIFGLLAVLASIRVQYSILNVSFAYGSLNLVPIIDDIIVLWSFYAFFMITGLSRDVVGKTVARVCRGVSTVFLQWSFIILGFLLFPAGLLAYGARMFLFLLLILLAVVIGFVALLSKKRFSFKDWWNKRKDFGRVLTSKEKRVTLLGFIILSSVSGVLYYPKEWVASTEMVLLFYVVAAVAMSIYLFLQEPKTDETYPPDDNYC